MVGSIEDSFEYLVLTKVVGSLNYLGLKTIKNALKTNIACVEHTVHAVNDILRYHRRRQQQHNNQPQTTRERRSRKCRKSRLR